MSESSIFDAMKGNSSLLRAVISDILSLDLREIDPTWNFQSSGKRLLGMGPLIFRKSGFSLSAQNRFIVKCGGRCTLEGMLTAE